MKALVIGAGGFVGSYLVKHLIESGDEVYGTTGGGAASADLGERAFRLDITDKDACREIIHRCKPEVVYHLAGVSFVPEAEADFDKTLAVNVGGTSHLVRECHLLASGVKFLFVSSAEVYGAVKPHELPITEENDVRPSNNYSLSKRMAELVIERYRRQGDVRCTTVRPFNHIGPGQDSRFVVSNFALQLARIAHKITPPVLEVGNLEARRDFSDVRDIVKAYRLLMTEGKEGTYNLGSGQARSIQEVLDLLISISGLAVDVRIDPKRMRGPEVKELYASCDKVGDECGWRARISLEESVRDVYRYWLDRVSSPA
jgi:GDP-4-dehydro-6-deoxy-D-mannose reductase